MTNVNEDNDDHSKNNLLNKNDVVEVKIESPKSEEINRNNSNSEDASITSQDDLNRKELLWEKREEKIFLKWLENCRIKTKKHDNKSKLFKIKYGVCSIPSITIPIIVSGLSSSISCDSTENSILMMITALFTCINTFFNYHTTSNE